jgi:ketosteroid isomerase-like protein
MNFKRFAGAALAVVFALAVSPKPAFADDKADVTVAVHKFFDNLDAAHLKTALAACDSPASIIDEFPPHEWHGATACADWWKAYNEYNKKSGITDTSAALGGPWSVDVTGDRAYFVAPATYMFKQHGKPVNEDHAVFTVALRKTSAGWKITGWSWAKH